MNEMDKMLGGRIIGHLHAQGDIGLTEQELYNQVVKNAADGRVKRVTLGRFRQTLEGCMEYGFWRRSENLRYRPNEILLGLYEAHHLSNSRRVGGLVMA